MVTANSTLTDLPVLNWQPSKGNHEVGVLSDCSPRRGKVNEVGNATEYMRKDDLCSGEAVRVDRSGVPTDCIQETVYMTLRMMKPPGARPPV